MKTRFFSPELFKSWTQEFQTPFFVYDAATIRERIKTVQSFGTVRYAVKACSNLAILSLMRQCGVVVDSVSLGEMHRVQKVGYDFATTHPDQVVFTCDVFDRPSLDFVVANGVAVNCGSIDMIAQYGERSPQRKDITLRINPGFGHGHSQKTDTGGTSSKHGIWHEQLGQALKTAKKYGLTVEGIHMHIGSGSDFEHLSQVAQKMKAVALEVGDSVHTISAGGGLPIPYHKDDEPIDFEHYKEVWFAMRDELARELGHEVSLEIEPGRYLVAESGILVTEIRAVKRQGEQNYYIVDAGFHNNPRPVMYGAYHDITAHAVDGRAFDAEDDYVVAGPLCESGDMFTQTEGGVVSTRKLPTAQVGDYLVLHDAGAYCASMGSHYNTKAHAAEVLWDEGKSHVVRVAEAEPELFRHESIPEHLR